MHRSRLSLELLLVAALIAGGTWLRWCHLGTPSLWWDEIVHIRSAEEESAAQVWRRVRDGVAPGLGNAAAMPLDYLALHAWLRATPRPAPEDVERHYRTPAFLFAVAALAAAWALGRSLGGSVTGILALALLATSIPHVLYAAEARFYSLSVLATLANLLAFAALARRPTARRWLVFGAVNVLYVLTALYGLFPIALEHLVLLGAAWRTRRVGPGVLGAAVSALVLGGVMASYLAPSAITTVYPRGYPEGPGPLGALGDTLVFFAGGSLVLAVAFGASVLLALVAGRRDDVVRALVAVVALSVGTIPLIVVIAQWKHYYFHPRHVLFLLPMVQLSTAIVAGAGLERLVRGRALASLVGVAVVVGVAYPSVSAYVANPLPFFHETKTLRDFRGLAQTLAARAALLAPGEQYLLLLERRRPGHLANPLVAFYLDAYGLTGRVVLRGVADPLPALNRLAAACPGGCRGAFDPTLPQTLDATDPFDQVPPLRRLLRLGTSPGAGKLGGAGIVTWAPNVPHTTPRGLVRTAFDGLALFEPGGS